MSIYDKLLEYQQIPNAYDDWADYRYAVTDYIVQSTAFGSSLAIYGAGKCNDIDLRLLSKHFSAITLFDANGDSMTQALARYSLTDFPQIKCVSADFTGIAPDDYRAFADELTALCNVKGAETDISMLTDYACYKLSRLYEKADAHTLDFGNKVYDYAMAFGVHSQINNMAAWIFSAFLANLAQADSTFGKEVWQLVKRANNKLIPRLNDAIFHATKTAAFFGCELKNTAVAGGIEGACECIEHLQKSGCVISQAVAIWPFDPSAQRFYEMLLQTVDCTSLA